MKKIYIGLLFSLFSLLACQDEGIDEKGEGRLALNVAFNTKTNPIIAVRSGERDYTVTITNAKGNKVGTYNHNELPDEIMLSPDTYSATVTSGNNPDAAFSSPYFTGSKEFTVKANETTETTIECLLANAKVSVNYSERIKQHFSSYQTTIGITKGEGITYTEENTQDGYFKVLHDSIQLTWELTVCNTSGQVFTQSGNFYAKKRWHYTLNFDIQDREETEEGGLKVDLIVKDDMKQVDNYFDIILSPLPEIEGDGFDITAPVTLQFNKYEGNYVIKLKGNPKLNSIDFSHNCSYLKNNGIPYNFSLLELTPNGKNTMKNNGLVWEFAADSTTASMDFTALFPKLKVGNYSFSFEISNTEGKKKNATVMFTIVNADVSTLSTPTGTSDDVWAHHARVAGMWITDQQPADLQIRYREKGNNNWITQNAEDIETNKKKFYVTLQNLKAATTYEYQAFSLKEGTEAYANILTFTTESAAPLPNGSFDEWDGTYPWAAGSSERDKFWDTGNKAAETAKLVLTQSSDDTPAEVAGGKSAYLKSQYTRFLSIADVFAAGNIFSGKFGKIENASGASMTFGQPYTSRPQKLKGYYKYKSKTIDWDKKGGLKGYEDRFHIYIILTDEAHFLNTTDQSTLFDMDNIKAGKDPHTIAFAELSNEKFDASGKDITPAVNMNNYEAFELELNYFKTDIKPSYIIVAATSSKYGDYYTGGIGSELYIDAFELVFE